MRRALLELLVPSVCPGCDRVRREGELLLCVTCAAGLSRQPWLGQVATAIAYRGSAVPLIQRFKFEGRRDSLPVLVELLAERIAEMALDVVVPVPRHAARVREQGGDPAFELARALARRSGLALESRALSRSRATPPQTGLAARARAANVRDSFRARAAALRGRRVLLLDDVTTTGATLAEARRALRRAQPRSAVPIALAGTPAL